MSHNHPNSGIFIGIIKKILYHKKIVVTTFSVLYMSHLSGFQRELISSWHGNELDDIYITSMFTEMLRIQRILIMYLEQVAV